MPPPEAVLSCMMTFCTDTIFSFAEQAIEAIRLPKEVRAMELQAAGSMRSASLGNEEDLDSLLEDSGRSLWLDLGQGAHPRTQFLCG